MDISNARQLIDSIDRQITDLFCQRMACSAAIGAYKKEQGLPIFVPEREQMILRTLAEQAAPEYKEYVQMLYTRIFELSRQYQTSLIEKEG